MYDRILVPTDGSDVASAAADAAIALAGRFDARLDVVHVLELGELPPGVEEAGTDELARAGERATTEVVERATEAGVEATGTIVEDGVPVHRALLDYAEEHDVDCIVMGTYGRTGLGRVVLGSVTERTLRESPVPVLTVHDETAFDPAFDAVLVPTDGSACAEAAAERAIDLATETGAALHAVHVVDLGVIHDDVDAGAVLDALEATGEQALQRVIGRAEETGVSTVEASVLSGRPHRAIVDYAAEYDVDLIVMGTHGRTGLDRYLLGSVTERVVRLSDVPVLAVGEEAEDEADEAAD
jgi:nucleotide-binding universal stress UspA family protein